jgi:hypothetical protein
MADSPALSEVTVTSFSGIVLKEVIIPLTDLKSWAFEPVLNNNDIKNITIKVIFIFMA